jgi:sugar O-acyltransferase (sialic acid O-acetyltransferase NeuD family)
MASEQIVVFSAGSFGREIAWLAGICGHKAACFIDDDVAKQGRLVDGIPVMTLAEARQKFSDARVVLAVHRPAIRELLMTKVADAGFGFATLIHPSVELSPGIEIGEGTIVCAGTIFALRVVLGRHVQVTLGCTVGHDVVMGDFATLSPGVHVSGCVRLGRRAYMGTGAVVVNGTEHEPLVIGDDAVVGAGACVTKSVPPGVTVVGVPARPIERQR